MTALDVIPAISNVDKEWEPGDGIWDRIKRLKSANENVWKYVFEKGDAVAEAVLYKYPTFEERTVICCSTQSGCPVGCRFCFLPGSIISIPNGSIKIENVKVGDIVSGRNGPNIVKEVFSRQYSGDVIKIQLENGKSILVTADHPMILKDGSIKEAGLLSIVDELLDVD